jgi:hypothetical protein
MHIWKLSKETYLVFKSTVFSFRILTNSDKINIIIPSFITREAVARPNVGIQIKLFPKSKVQGTMAFSNRCGHWPF